MLTTRYPSPPEWLRQRLDYDPATGIFRWKQDAFSGGLHIFNGAIAGRTSSNGYRQISAKRLRYSAQRLAWWFTHGTYPAEEIDHINGDKLDNRICNLRLACRSQNMQNRGKRPQNTTGFKGVTFSKRRRAYVAQIVANGVAKYLGQYDSAAEAHEAYKAAASRLHGEFARTE